METRKYEWLRTRLDAADGCRCLAAVLGASSMDRGSDEGAGTIAMNLIPRALVVGVFIPPPGVVPGVKPVTSDVVNRIWSEVTGSYPYRHLEIAPDGSAAHFLGASADEQVAIQGPLLQVRDVIGLDAKHSAEKAETILKVIARQLGVAQFFNMGIKHVYHAPVANNDARAFVLQGILGKTDADLGELQLGGDAIAGVKYVLPGPDRQYTLRIEPLLGDLRNLFIDLDAQFPGDATLDDVTTRAKDAERYMTQAVSAYLDKHSGMDGGRA
jgi:hypothetical protein